MTKIDKLFKRAELFEKLASYGDRKVFLKTLSQANAVDENIAYVLNRIYIFLKNSGMPYKSYEVALSAIQNALVFKKLELGKIIKELTSLYNKFPASAGPNKTVELSGLVNDLRETAKSVGYNEEEFSTLMEMPEDKITGKRYKGYSSIDPNIQDMLNRIFDNEMVPLKNDGKLGPDTQAALNKFKQKYPGKTVKQVFNEMQQRQAGTPMSPVSPTSLPVNIKDDSKSEA